MSATPLMPDAPLAVGYLRVSKEEQARGDKTSLADQEQAVRRLAGRHHVPLAELFTDAGISGGTAEDRPAFMALVAFCRAHPRPRTSPGHVFVLNDSRWGRFDDFEDATFWRALLRREHGWVVRFVEGDDTDNTTARGVLRAIYSAQASAYREQIKRNARQGARGTATQGFWQTEAPMGYRRLAEEPGRAPRVLDVGQRKAESERVRLTQGPDAEVALVRWMFETYAEGGVSLGRLARLLDIRWPSRRWSRTTVQQVLKNRTYLGEVIWCRRPHDRVERLERAVRDPSEWVTCRGAHPALITSELFDRVARRLRENKVQLRHAKVEYLLSGILRCAHCGEPYLGAGGPVGPVGDVDRYRFYRDRGFDPRYATCPGLVGTLPRRIIEPLVLKAIGHVVAHPTARAIMGRIFDELAREAERGSGSRREALEQERGKLEAERHRLVEAVAAGTLLAGEVGPRMSAVRARLETLSQAGERERFDDRMASRYEAERERILDLAADFPAEMAKRSGAARRDLVAAWLEGASVDKFTRRLTLTIRRVPALGLFSVVAGTPGPDGHCKNSHLVVTRTLQLPAAGGRARKGRVPS